MNSSPFTSVGNGGFGVNNSLFNSIANPGDNHGAFAGTIASLTYQPANNDSLIRTWQNTLLNSQLNITGNGGLVVGNGLSGVNYGVVENVTISGASSTLAVNNPNAFVWVTMGGAATQTATLDLSGLGTFTANVGHFLVGVQGKDRPSAVVYLAQNNTITAVSTPP